VATALFGHACKDLGARCLVTRVGDMLCQQLYAFSQRTLLVVLLAPPMYNPTTTRMAHKHQSTLELIAAQSIYDFSNIFWPPTVFVLP
jgi:hypothetical protein